MDESSFEIILQNLFDKSSQEDWQKIAARESGDENPLGKLQWESTDGIRFRPYYDAADESELQFVRGFDFYRDSPRSWLNVPIVSASDPSEANRLSLDHLLNGADGVMLDTRGVSMPDISRMMREIEWNHCYLAFCLDSRSTALPPLQQLLGAYSADPIAGTLFWKDFTGTTDLSFFLRRPIPFRALGLMVGESSPAREISDALFGGVRMFDAYHEQADADAVFRAIAFSLPAEAGLLENIAKFKALRMLWFQIARAYGFKKYLPRELFLHARSHSVQDGSFGPHENMLKGTFAAMAALMGGCDALTVESYGSASFASRCARNISTILREESFFDRDADPLRGAWTVDALTHALAKEAWKLFQEKIRANETT